MDLTRHSPTPQPVSVSGMTADMREASRTQLSALRPAKLICLSGEYVCMLRDVSASGVKLGLFHHLPPTAHAFLELSNGEIYPMLGVWQDERQASFRFAQPVDPVELIAEPGTFPRRAIRISARKPGLAFADGWMNAIELRDISTNGASFVSDAHFALGQTLVLSIDGLPELACWVRWRERRGFGVVFDHGLRLDELAAHALALAPIPDEDEAAVARYA